MPRIPAGINHYYEYAAVFEDGARVYVGKGAIHGHNLACQDATRHFNVFEDDTTSSHEQLRTLIARPDGGHQVDRVAQRKRKRVGQMKSF